jgi:hypothetical protein
VQIDAGVHFVITLVVLLALIHAQDLLDIATRVIMDIGEPIAIKHAVKIVRVVIEAMVPVRFVKMATGVYHVKINVSGVVRQMHATKIRGNAEVVQLENGEATVKMCARNRAPGTVTNRQANVHVKLDTGVQIARTCAMNQIVMHAH